MGGGRSNGDMSSDAWSPPEIAARVERAGVAKARAGTLRLLLLAVLAGAFIALGGLFYLAVVTDSALGWGPTRLLGGLAFALGLGLVVVGGAELFTGNNLVAMAWASGRIRGAELLRNWALVYVGNALGAAATALLAHLAGLARLADGALGRTAASLARDKVALGALEGWARGVLCNALVCLAVWLAFGGRSVSDKLAAVALPVAAFVALGLEHCVANFFFLPFGAWSGAGGEAALGTGAWRNLCCVSVGNLCGGGLLVAGVYWLAYLGPGRESAD